MSARSRFLQFALSKLGEPVLWSQKGPHLFDCSGLVTWSLMSCGGPDLRLTHNSQRLADETADLTTARPEALEPVPGDLLFFGDSAHGITHVAIVLAGGKCISADGASSHLTSEQVARANPRNRVRLHERFDFRPDLPFRSVHRNTLVDAIDGICL